MPEAYGFTNVFESIRSENMFSTTCSKAFLIRIES